MNLFIYLLSTMLWSADPGISAAGIQDRTLQQIADLSGRKARYFKPIMQNRAGNGWQRRLDSLACDYAFITETGNIHSGAVSCTERYFKGTDSLPFAVYINGVSKDISSLYVLSNKQYRGRIAQQESRRNTLMALSDHFSRLKPVQAYPYEREQLWSHGCVVGMNDRSKFTRERKQQIRSRVQVQTMVDRLQNRAIVSLQLPVKRPRFETLSYMPVWDF